MLGKVQRARCWKGASSFIAVVTVAGLVWGGGNRTACAFDSTAVPGQQPRAPAYHSSANFQLLTDLPSAQAEELLEQLERMLTYVTAYWGRPNRKPIRMYVVDDLDCWPQNDLERFPQAAVDAVRRRGGITLTMAKKTRQGRTLDAAAVVYTASDYGSPQHEAIHAYCAATFGSLGPVWYSEGMAEVGKYWKENDRGVNASQAVIRYLKSTPPRPLDEIVNNPLETTGDSWKNYAWRWALCHLLGSNGNYSERFRPLGLALMGGRKTTFWRVYGGHAEEIEFEFKLFLQDMEPGYRCDLCSWDWKTPFTEPRADDVIECQVLAGRGWQASGVAVKAGSAYQVHTEGTWQLSADAAPVSAVGDEWGRGRLIGVVFQDYALSEVFEIGHAGTFTAPADGTLYVRCRDEWGAIGDNAGSITVQIETALSPADPLQVADD